MVWTNRLKGALIVLTGATLACAVSRAHGDIRWADLGIRMHALPVEFNTAAIVLDVPLKMEWRDCKRYGQQTNCDFVLGEAFKVSAGAGDGTDLVRIINISPVRYVRFDRSAFRSAADVLLATLKPDTNASARHSALDKLLGKLTVKEPMSRLDFEGVVLKILATDDGLILSAAGRVS